MTLLSNDAVATASAKKAYLAALMASVDYIATNAQGTAGGLANTTSGQTFAVVSADGATAALYRNSAGSASALGFNMLGEGMVNRAILDVQNAGAVFVSQAESWAATVAPRAYVNVENPQSGKAYTADYSIRNGLTFTRFYATLTGSGSMQIAVLANGVVYGPVTVDDDGFASTISVTIPAGNDISFSVVNITGIVSFFHASIDGDPA